MCNAWNHSANCTCGWGGSGHLGRRPPAETAPTVPSLGYRLNSYTNPNAKCPVCGKQVFFYHSPEGGRVFFDSLGPPWPKHPCTHNDSNRISLPFGTDSLSSDKHKNQQIQFPWQREEWAPFLCSDIAQIPPDYKCSRLAGTWDTKMINLYAKPPQRLSAAAAYQVRRIDAMTFEVSTIKVRPNHQVEEIRFRAYLRLDAYAFASKDQSNASKRISSKSKKKIHMELSNSTSENSASRPPPSNSATAPQKRAKKNGKRTGSKYSRRSPRKATAFEVAFFKAYADKDESKK